MLTESRDLYAELGVEPGASREEIAAAFRARAKELHPDVRPGDAVTAEAFKRLGAAYRTLADPQRRAHYDLERSFEEQVRPPVVVHDVPVAVPSRVDVATRPGLHLTRRGARSAFWGGLTMVVIGLLVVVWVLSLQDDDAGLTGGRVMTTAIVVEVSGTRDVQFSLANGRTVTTRPSPDGDAAPPVGERVDVAYARADPADVVIVGDHTGRDVTIWIVAVKLLVGGAILAVVGRRRLRRA